LPTFADLGIALSVLGTLITIVFGLTASTRSSLREFRSAVVPRLDRHTLALEDVRADVQTLRQLLEDRLPRSPN